jgi:hypothetical protein
VHAGDLDPCYVEIRRMLRLAPLDLQFEAKMECVVFLKIQCELQNSRTCIECGECYELLSHLRIRPGEK